MDQVEKRSIGWLTAAGLGGGGAGRAWLVGTNSAEFFARITPTGDTDRLQIASDWCYWGFSFDDEHCDADPAGRAVASFVAQASILHRHLEAPTGRPAGTGVHAGALVDIADRFRRCATPVQYRRWTEAHRGWLLATAWQFANTERGTAPDLADYLTMRLNSCAGGPTLAMIEIVNGAEIPAAEMDSPRIRALTEVTQLVAALDNDLVSVRKELRYGQADQNIIGVLAADRPPAAALEAALAIRDRLMTLFLRLREAALPAASQELRRYLTDLGHVLRGNLEWSLRVPRYNSLSPLDAPPATPAGLFPGWSDHPSSTDDTPLPVPAISWWWDQLDT